MKYNSDIHKRKSIRLKSYNYSQKGLYFIITCSFQGEYLFGEIVDGKMRLNKYGKIVVGEWLKLKENMKIELHSFIVMPNHFHGIIEILEAPRVGAIHELPLHEEQKFRRKMLIPKLIGKFKMLSAKKINEIRGMQGVPVWQRNYFDNILVDKKTYILVSNYINNNPKNWKEDKFYKYFK